MKRTILTGRALVLVVAIGSAACGKTRDEHFFAGNRYAEAKQYREAAVEFKNAIKQDLRFGQAHLRLADVLIELKEPGAAAAEYVRAAELLPADVEVQVKAASLLLLGRRFEEARLLTEKALALDPSDITARMVHANALAGLNEIDAAKSEMAQVAELDPKQSTVYSNLGVLNQASGSLKEAEANFRKAVEVDADSIKARLHLGSFLFTEGRTADAEAELKQARAIDSTSVEANRALAEFYIRTNRAPEAETYLKETADSTKTVDSRLALADYYLAAKQVDKAKALLEALAVEPNGYSEARSRLASIEYSAGHTAEAHRLIDETLKRDPAHPRALLTKAQFLLVENKVDEALIRVRGAIASDGRSKSAHFLLGTILASRQDFEQATREFNEVLKIDPQSVEAKTELSRLNLARGLPALAGDFAQQVVQAQPRDLKSRLLLVRTLVNENQAARAENELKPILAQFPMQSEVQWLAGTVALLKADIPAARKLFEKALELQPDALEALDSLVSLELQTNHVPRALELLEPRLQQRPNDAALLILAARTFETANNFPKAEELIRRAIAADPSNRQAYGMLGQLFVSQDKLEAGRIEFEELVRRDPKSVGAQTMLGMIFQSQDKSAQAQQHYQRALDVDQNAVIAANNLAWLYAEKGGGNLDVALQMAQAAKRQVPEQPYINDTLGWLYLKKDLPALAIPPLQISVQKAPRNPAYHYHLGMAYAKTGDKARARQSLETAMALSSVFEGSEDAQRILNTLK